MIIKLEFLSSFLRIKAATEVTANDD